MWLISKTLSHDVLIERIQQMLIFGRFQKTMCGHMVSLDEMIPMRLVSEVRLRSRVERPDSDNVALVDSQLEEMENSLNLKTIKQFKICII